MQFDETSHIASSSAISTSMNKSKHEMEISRLLKKNEERDKQRMSSGIKLKRSLVAQ